MLFPAKFYFAMCSPVPLWSWPVVVFATCIIWLWIQIQKFDGLDKLKMIIIINTYYNINLESTPNINGKAMPVAHVMMYTAAVFAKCCNLTLKWTTKASWEKPEGKRETLRGRSEGKGGRERGGGGREKERERSIGKWMSRAENPNFPSLVLRPMHCSLKHWTTHSWLNWKWVQSFSDTIKVTLTAKLSLDSWAKWQSFWYVGHWTLQQFKQALLLPIPFWSFFLLFLGGWVGGWGWFQSGSSYFCWQWISCGFQLSLDRNRSWTKLA